MNTNLLVHYMKGRVHVTIACDDRLIISHPLDEHEAGELTDRLVDMLKKARRECVDPSGR